MLKGSVRKQILKELHMGAPVTLIVKTSRNRFMTIPRAGVKIRNKNTRKMIVAFGGLEREVCYFNLTCQTIELAIRVTGVLSGGNNDLPF